MAEKDEIGGALRCFQAATPAGRMLTRTNQLSPSPGPPAIILVHGLIVSSRYMIPIARLLASDFRVYAIDLPGYGVSEKPPRALTVTEAADALAGWMDTVSLASAHLLGNSYGCQVAAEFATRYPDRVQRLVLQGPTINPHQHSFWRQLPPFVMNLRYEPMSLVWLVARDWWAIGPPRSAQMVRQCLADYIEDKLPRVQAPTLVVCGAKDPHVPRYWAEEAAQLLPRGELKIVPGYGHCLNYTAPLELRRVIEPFLREGGRQESQSSAAGQHTAKERPV